MIELSLLPDSTQSTENPCLIGSSPKSPNQSPNSIICAFKYSLTQAPHVSPWFVISFIAPAIKYNLLNYKCILGSFWLNNKKLSLERNGEIEGQRSVEWLKQQF